MRTALPSRLSEARKGSVEISSGIATVRPQRNRESTGMDYRTGLSDP